LKRSQLAPPVRGTLRITEMDRATTNHKRNVLRVDLWGAFGTTRMRGLLRLFDPVLLPTLGDSLLIAGIELHSEDQGEKIWEYRQVWLCRPTMEADKN
jgi:hypothetical protein